MTDPQLLIDENTKLKEKVILLQKENDFLREKFKLAQHRQFGASSEKSPDQIDWLFNEAEAIVDAVEPESDAAAVVATDVNIGPTDAQTKQKTGRKPLPADLPRETRIIDLADAQKICPCCNGDLHICIRLSKRQKRMP